jgi:hypothetical protein
MTFYSEGRIAEEQRIRRAEEDEHIRLCNAGISQKHHVWENKEEKAKWESEWHRWMTDHDYRSRKLDEFHRQRLQRMEHEPNTAGLQRRNPANLNH